MEFLFYSGVGEIKSHTYNLSPTLMSSVFDFKVRDFHNNFVEA